MLINSNIAKISVIVAVCGVGGYIAYLKVRENISQNNVTKYEKKISELDEKIKARDVTISEYLVIKEVKIKEALIAKEQADQFEAQANSATARYNHLKDSVTAWSPDSPGDSPDSTTASPGEVFKACDEVIAPLKLEVKSLQTGLSNCFDSKAAADRMILELNGQKKDLQESNKNYSSINGELKAEMALQARRKRLYLAGAFVLGGLTGYQGYKYLKK